MKTPVNKANPAIRITAPEIDTATLYNGTKVYWIPLIHEFCGSFSTDRWILVEEDPIDLKKFIEEMQYNYNKLIKELAELGKKEENNMNAKDLMSWDWVQIVSDAPVMPNEYHRIDWIRTNRKIVTYPYIQPIPLTSEILEKNFPEPTDGLTWYPEEGGFNCHTYVPKCEINAFGLFKYVHELQHALRLCGIKDIEL